MICDFLLISHLSRQVSTTCRHLSTCNPNAPKILTHHVQVYLYPTCYPRCSTLVHRQVPHMQSKMKSLQVVQPPHIVQLRLSAKLPKLQLSALFPIGAFLLFSHPLPKYAYLTPFYTWPFLAIPTNFMQTPNTFTSRS